MLNQVDGIRDYVVEVFTNPLGTDALKLHLLVEKETRLKTEEVLRSTFQSRLKVVPLITYVDQVEIEKIQLDGKSRKSKKFIDSRK